jgi:serine/threonine protein kinase
LQHPRIVRVYDLVVDEDSDMAYFEMDLVLSPDGQPRTLADELQDGVDEEKIVGWFRDICEGLAYIHSQGVVHRDISLDNILIGRDGRAVITDFGIAKIIDDSYRKKIDMTVTMVYKDGSEVRIGKERYMAPELKMPNGRASFATDAWALGVLLFRMLSGSWYDVGTRLEDWHADLKYNWRPVLSQLFDIEPKNRLGNGGIASLPTLLNRKKRFGVSWLQQVKKNWGSIESGMEEGLIWKTVCLLLILIWCGLFKLLKKVILHLL